MIFVSRNIHQKAQIILSGCMPKQTISYALHSSSSNKDILLLGKRRINLTDIKPTFEQYYHLLLGKLTVPTEYMLVPYSNDVK